MEITLNSFLNGLNIVDAMAMSSAHLIMRIGDWTGIGNQMFQVAACLQLAVSNKFRFLINPVYKFALHTAFPYFQGRQEYVNNPPPCSEWKEQGDYDPSFRQLQPTSNMSVHGYMQSYRYIMNYLPSLQNIFVFHPDIVLKCQTRLSSNLSEIKIGVHIRMPDIHNEPLDTFTYFVPTAQFVNDSIQYFQSLYPNAKFILCSNDVPRAREYLSLSQHPNFIWIDDSSNGAEDMCLLSLCDHFILSASTFGIWAALLGKNPDKKVIFSTPMFSPKNRDPKLSIENRELFFPGWIIYDMIAGKFRDQSLLTNQLQLTQADLNKIIKIENQSEVTEFLSSIAFLDEIGRKTIMFTNGNSWYIDTLIKNLIVSYNVWNTKARKIGVFCSDDEACTKAKTQNFTYCKIDIPDLGVDTMYDSADRKHYQKLCFVKIVLIHHALTLGYQALYIDPDMAFNNNRTGEKIDYIDSILRCENSHKFVFSDTKHIMGLLIEGSEPDLVIAGSPLYWLNNGVHGKWMHINSNLMMARPTDFNKWLFYPEKDPIFTICSATDTSDEDYINRVTAQQETKHMAFWNSILYPPGNKAVEYKDKAFMFHANCVVGLQNKIDLLKQCNAYSEGELSHYKKDQKTDSHKHLLKEWQTIEKPENELIVQASVVDGSDSLTSVPIGMSWQYMFQKGNSKSCQTSTHYNLILCAISQDTDSRRRPKGINRKSIIETLERNGIRNINLEHGNYYKLLPTFKFVICPEGNGIDTHRLYESLLAGCVPIVEHNDAIKNKYGNCPILYTIDYSEITIEYLEQKYKEIVEMKWDFSKLFISSWTRDEQLMIRTRGNYWCGRMTGKFWYQ